jgi:FMN reductase
MSLSANEQPLIVGIGATASAVSSTEQALVLALRSASNAGSRIRLFGNKHLVKLPHYLTEPVAFCAEAQELLIAIRQADGLIIASPGYHGSISGLVKNAIDYVEETSKDARPYLDGVPVGLITTAYGWQATGSTLATLRSIVHALRGWPTPLGCSINSAGGIFKDGECVDSVARTQLEIVGKQVVEFARMRKQGTIPALG